ncbi:MAG: ABC transporter permease [Romboutsia sp.]
MNLFSFLILPLFMSLFFIKIGEIGFQNLNTSIITPIIITDNDKSDSSKIFIDFIDRDLNQLFKITNKKDTSDLEIIIPSNYKESLFDNKETFIEIKKLTTKSNVSNLLKNIIDDYHENLYFTDVETSFIENTFVKSNLTQTSSEYFSIFFLTYLAIMFIINFVLGDYLCESNGCKKRMLSMPISRVTLLFYNFMTLFIYSLIFVLSYILIHRYLNVSFIGNIYILIFLAMIVSLFTSSCSNFISVFFSKKYGQIIVYISLFAQTILGGMLTPFVDNLEKFYKISPLYLINDLFTKFTEYNNINSIIEPTFIILSISLILFVASILKEKYNWREF